MIYEQSTTEMRVTVNYACVSHLPNYTHCWDLYKNNNLKTKYLSPNKIFIFYRPWYFRGTLYRQWDKT